MVESSLSPSLQRLISTLSKLGLTGSEIAETIWLAVQPGDSGIITIDVVAEPMPEEEKSPEVEENPTLPGIELNDEATAPSHGEIVPPPVEKTSSLALPPNYKRIPVPDAPAISQALLLARALRPLARQIAFGLPTILDELATVNRIAETGICNRFSSQNQRCGWMWPWYLILVLPCVYGSDWELMSTVCYLAMGSFGMYESGFCGTQREKLI